MKTTHGSKILALDPATQPYPPKECLYPPPGNLEPQMITNSASSLTLQIPKVGKRERCLDLETAVTEYTIYYQLQSSKHSDYNDEPILSVNTVDREVVLYNLSTFKNYTVYLEASNYYARMHDIPAVKGSSVIVQTAAEGKDKFR